MLLFSTQFLTGMIISFLKHPVRQGLDERVNALLPSFPDFKFVSKLFSLSVFKANAMCFAAWSLSPSHPLATSLH